MTSDSYWNDHFDACPAGAEEKDWAENPVCRCDAIMKTLEDTAEEFSLYD